MLQTSVQAKNDNIIQSNSWQIVPVGTGDIPEIIHLACIIWPIAYAEILSPSQVSYMLNLMYSKSALEQQIDSGEQYFYLIKQGNKNAGFAAIGPVSAGFSYLPASQPQSPWKLHKLYVLPQYHGTGMGKALLTYCLHEVVKQGGDYLVLNVNRANSAYRFYQKNEFTILASDDFDIGNGFYMNDFIMGRPLK